MLICAEYKKGSEEIGTISKPLTEAAFNAAVAKLTPLVHVTGFVWGPWVIDHNKRESYTYEATGPVTSPYFNGERRDASYSFANVKLDPIPNSIKTALYIGASIYVAVESSAPYEIYDNGGDYFEIYDWGHDGAGFIIMRRGAYDLVFDSIRVYIGDIDNSFWTDRRKCTETS